MYEDWSDSNFFPERRLPPSEIAGMVEVLPVQQRLCAEGNTDHSWPLFQGQGQPFLL